MKKRKTFWTAMVFISPAIVGYLAFNLVPFLNAIRMSFFQIRGIKTPIYVGFDNFKELLFSDSVFHLSLYNSFYYALIGVPLGLAVALSMALLLRGALKGIGIFRTAFYLPSVTPVVATAIVATALFSPTGLVNDVLSWFGIEGPAWFGDPKWTKLTLIVMAQWGAGGACLIFLAGLNSIPKMYYEAASMDGASKLKQFFTITLPLLSPIMLLNTLSGVIGALQTFTTVYVITNGGGGGPLNSMLFVVLYIYKKAFQSSNFGYAAAASLILFIIVVFISVTIWVTRTYWVHEGQDEV